MKKLYNLYKQVILEATEVEMVKHAIENGLNVNIIYDNGKDDGTASQKRYCQIYNLGTTSGGNQAVRVYQISGPNINTKKGETRWKTFRLDRIIDWQETNFKVNQPISTSDHSIPYNNNQDITLNHGNLQLRDFNKQ